MIYDNLKNIHLYKGVSEDIHRGLEFLKSITPDIEFGTFWLTPKIKVMVTEYNTKIDNELGYESHKQFIDIQYPIIGEELILCQPIEKLEQTTEYDVDRDIMFYRNNSSQHTDVVIGNGYFTVLYPDDGHEPQHCMEEPKMIKKVTLKISI